MYTFSNSLIVSESEIDIRLQEQAEKRLDNVWVNLVNKSGKQLRQITGNT